MTSDLSSCDENEDLGRAALSCVRNYYNHVQSAQKEILDKFQTQINKMKDEQADSYDRTQTGYNDARKSLRALIEDGKLVRADIDSLYLNMFYPGDYDEPSMTGMSTEAYLDSEPCFAIPKRVMLQSQQMVDKMMKDVETVEITALGKENNSQTRSAKVQVFESSKQVTNKKVGVGSGFEPRRFQKNESDITGTNRKPSKLESQPKRSPASGTGK